MVFELKMNGTNHSVDVDGDIPLLSVLRDELGMTGTKFGCALCGACTVHIDGAATPKLLARIMDGAAPLPITDAASRMPLPPRASVPRLSGPSSAN